MYCIVVEYDNQEAEVYGPYEFPEQATSVATQVAERSKSDHHVTNVSVAKMKAFR